MIRALSTTSCGYDKETEKNFHVGSKVEALYNYGRAYYLGIITRRNADGTYDIAFDDGDTEQFVSSEKIRVAQEGDLLVGSKVEAYNKNTRRHYIGTIKEVQNTLYTIKFDDDELQFKVPRETIGVLTDIYRIAEKSKVEVSFDNGKTTKRGTVDRVNIDDTYNIEFDDGGYEVRVDIQNIRLPRTTSSDYDEDTKKDFSIGSKVEALYKYGKAYYLGKISTINFNGTYNIAFDDGDSEQFVSSERIRAAQEGDLIVGSKVEARNEAKRGVYIGTITEVQNTLYTIKFDDGRVQFKVPRGTIGVLTGNERIAEKSKVEVSFDNGKTTKIGTVDRANIDDTYNIEFDDGGHAVRVGVQNIIRVQESEQSVVLFNLDKPSREYSDSKQDLKTKSISQKRSHIQKSKQQGESESSQQNERESKQEDISEAKQQEALVENIHSMIQQMLSKMKDSEKSLNDEQKSRSETRSKRSEDDKVTAFRDKLSNSLTDKAESLLHNYLSKQESCDHLFDLGNKEEQRTENACNGCHIAYTTSDNAGMTMLMHAAERGHINVVQFLINHATMSGFNVYVNKKETKWGYSALMLAVKGGHVEIVGELLKHRLPFESLNINDRASKNSVTSQRYSKGANQNTDTTNIDSGGYRSNRNETALHIACALPEEQTNIVNYLCSHKALTDIADDTGFTPLHHACIRGHVAIVVLLLNLGANATIKTHEQVSPLHLAAQYGHERIVKLLLERVSLLVNTEDRKGQTALHLAFERYFYLSHLGWETVNHFKDQFEELIEIKTSGDNNSINQGRMGISDNPSSKELEKLHTSDPKVCKGGRQIVESKHFNELHFPVGVIEKVKLVLSQIRESDNSFDTLELPMLVDIQTRKILFNFIDSSNPISSEDISETKENVGISNNSQNSHVTSYVSGVTTTKGVGSLYPFYEHESADLLSFSELFDFVNKTENLQQIGTAWKSATKTLSGLGNLEQLFFAIDSQNFLIKSLLDAGADMSKEDNRGTSAFSKYTQSRWFATHEHEMERIHDAPLEAGHEAEVFLDKRTQYAVHQVWVSNGRRCYALWLLFMWIVGLLLLTWVALKYSGRDSYEAPSMQAAMRERISSDEWDEYEIKSLEDVESIAEWQQYLENVFVNALWETNQTYIDTEGQIQYIGNQGALLSGHLGLVGRPRYRQLRTRPDACLNENPSIIPQTENFCFSPYTTRVYGSPLLSDEDRRNISCTLRNGTDLLLEWAEYQSYPVQGKYGYYRDGGFSIDLPSDYEEAISLLHDLGNCNFIDLNTRFAALEFTLYSRSQGLFTYGTVYLELTTTGMISPGQKWQTFKVVSYSTHQDLKDIWAEVLLGVFLLCYFASEVWSMLQPWPETRATKSLRASNGAITNQIVGSKYPVFWYPWIRKVEDQRSVARNKSTRFRKNWSVYLRKSSYIIPPYLYDGFNFVDVFVMFVVMWLISTHCLLVVQVNVAAPSWYELAASNMYIDVSHFLWLSAWRQYLLAITVFLFYIKTLEYLQVAPWLTIPILVIGGMLSRLAGFFAIFAVFIMAFGLFDYVLYGMEYEPVQSVWRGILGAFRASLGEVDFDGKIETDQTVGVVMSLAAASLLVILLLNLLIAIMNEAYEEIKETAEARWCYKQFSAYLAHQRRETMGFKFQLPFRYLHRLCCTKQELLKINVVEDENNNNMIQVLAKSTRRSQVAPALE